MKINAKSAVWILSLGLFAVLPLQAQPRSGGGGGGPGGMMRGGGGVDQILVFLAFDEKIKVSDKQWVKLRAALKDPYAKQREMREKMRQAWKDNEGDPNAGREAMMSMREEMGQANQDMKEKVTAVLDDKQTKRFEKHLKELQERRSNRGGGRWGRGGGGGGGGGGGSRGDSAVD